MTEPPFTQLVSQVLVKADAPLSLDEIIEQVQLTRPVRTRNPKTTIRNALNNITLAASLGGRPARYTWWPRHLNDNSFRLSLSLSNLEAGTLVMSPEVWMALWPDFFGGKNRSSGNVTIRLTDGPELQSRITPVPAGRHAWGLDASPELAAWYRRQNAAPNDELIVRILDREAHHCALALVHRADRPEDEIAARNRALADDAAALLRTARDHLADYYLVPRLIARDAFHHPLPPDSLEAVLSTDLRFVVGSHSYYLTERLVNIMEREAAVLPDPLVFPQPQGDRRRARSEEARRAWGAYLFDRGMDHLWQGWILEAEAYYRETLRLDPGHADAWVHLGNRRFDEGRLIEAMGSYKRGEAAARARTIGDPAQYPGPFWLDLDSRPFMRALHGQGLCLWRLGRVTEARRIFDWMLELNPNDNQGARFLLHDIGEELSWEESVARDEEQNMLPGSSNQLE